METVIDLLTLSHLAEQHGDYMAAYLYRAEAIQQQQDS